MPVRDHNAMSLRIGRVLVGAAILVALLLPAVVGYVWGLRAGVYLSLAYGGVLALFNSFLVAAFSGSHIKFDPGFGFLFAALACGVFAVMAALGAAVGFAASAPPEEQLGLTFGNDQRMSPAKMFGTMGAAA